MIEFNFKVDIDEKKIKEFAEKLKSATAQKIAQEALRLSKMMKQGLVAQSQGGETFAPLSKNTIAKKGSTKALIDTESMLRSIRARKLDEESWRIGIRRSAIAKDKKGNMINLSDLALFHEGIGREEGKIPKRPFLVPVYKKWMKDFFKNMAKGIKEETGL